VVHDVGQRERVGHEDGRRPVDGRGPDVVDRRAGHQADRGAGVDGGHERRHELEARRDGRGGEEDVVGAQPEPVGDAGRPQRHRRRPQHGALGRPGRARRVRQVQGRVGPVAVAKTGPG